MLVKKIKIENASASGADFRLAGYRGYVPGRALGGTAITTTIPLDLATQTIAAISARAGIKVTDLGVEEGPVTKAVHKKVAMNRAPEVTDDMTEGFARWSYWIDESGDTPEVYRCIDPSEGAAVWVHLSLDMADLAAAATRLNRIIFHDEIITESGLLTLDMAGKYVDVESVDAVTLIIPRDLYEEGDTIRIEQTGTGKVTVEPVKESVGTDGVPTGGSDGVAGQLIITITDEDAGRVTGTTIAVGGTPLDTSGIDFFAVTDGTELATALAGLGAIETATYDAETDALEINTAVDTPITIEGDSALYDDSKPIMTGKPSTADQYEAIELVFKAPNLVAVLGGVA